MKYLALLACLLFPTLSWASTYPTQAGSFVSLINDPTTGTFVNTLTSLNDLSPSGAILAPANISNGIIGITVSGAGRNNAALIQTLGQVNCQFDTATVAGDYVQISTSQSGYCHDVGSAPPTTGQILGYVLSTNGAAGIYTIYFAPQSSGSGGSGGPPIPLPVSFSNGGTGTNYGPPSLFIQLGNSTTSTNTLTKLTGAGLALQATTSDADGMVGVCQSGCGSSGTATIQLEGIATCAFDGATTQDDWVQVSATVAGTCHDAGAFRPGAGIQSIGRVLSTNGGAGNYQIILQLNGGSSGGTGGTPPSGAVNTIQTNGGLGAFGSYAGTSCANQVLTALNSFGAASCNTITSAYTDTSIAQTGVDINTLNQIIATHLTNPLPLAQGGTQCGPPTTVAGLPGSPVQGEICNVTNADACLSGTAVVHTTGTLPCQVTWNGSSWLPAGGATSGGVTSVGASAPITSSGGATPAIGLTTPLAVQYGGRQCGIPTTVANLPGSPTQGEICDVTDADACLSGTAVAHTSGTTKCQVTWNGASWLPAGGATSAVTTVTGSAPVTSSGGATPAIGLTVPLAVQYGGTQCGVPTTVAGLPGSPTQGEVCNVTDADTCTAGTAVAHTTGTSKCQVTWSGAAWLPAGGASSAASGGVTAVNATAPITSSGGTTPTVALTGPLAVQYGGTQCGVPTAIASLPGSPTQGQICNVTDADACTAGTAVVHTSGTTKCQVTWNGTSWLPAGGATSAASGGVTSVLATAPITSSGGATPTVALTGPLAVQYGGTQCGAPTTVAGLPGSPTQGEICNVTNADACVSGTAVVHTSGTLPCQVTWSGAAWLPAGDSTSAVTSVGATAPITSSGGATPTIAMTNPLLVQYGGTQCGVPTTIASLPGSPTQGEICNVTDADACTAGTSVVHTSGALKCQVTWNGSAWMPAGGASSAASTGVTSVSGTAPITSSGGATPAIGLTGPLAVQYGGRQCGAPSVYASLPGSPTNGEICTVTDAPACAVGSTITVGGGSVNCEVTYNGVNWVPAGGATTAAGANCNFASAMNASTAMSSYGGI